MVVGRVTKFAAVSLLTGTLSLGFASVVHADSAVTVDNHVSSSQQVGGNGSSGSSVSQKDSTSSSVSETTVQTVSTDKSDKNSVKASGTGSISNGSGSVGSQSSLSEVKTGASETLKADAKTPALPSTSGGTTENTESRVGQAPVGPSSNAPVALTPQVATQLATLKDQSPSQTAIIRHADAQLESAVALVPNPTKPQTPAPAVPAKDLPIQGALQGLSTVLSTTILPIGNFAALLAAAAQTHGAGEIMLVIIVLAAAALVVGRFVDYLRASGYTHAARADASNLFSFATPTKSEFLLGLLAQSQLTFFGVRNKPLRSQIYI